MYAIYKASLNISRPLHQYRLVKPDDGIDLLLNEQECIYRPHFLRHAVAKEWQKQAECTDRLFTYIVSFAAKKLRRRVFEIESTPSIFLIKSLNNSRCRFGLFCFYLIHND